MMSLKSQFLHSVRTPILTTTLAYIMLSLMICGGTTDKTPRRQVRGPVRPRWMYWHTSFALLSGVGFLSQSLPLYAREYSSINTFKGKNSLRRSQQGRQADKTRVSTALGVDRVVHSGSRRIHGAFRQTPSVTGKAPRPKQVGFVA